MDNAINNNNDPAEVPEQPIEEESRLQEFVANIPWGKIILGFFILFLLIWAIIYFFNRNSSATPTVTTSTSTTISAVDQSVAARGAESAVVRLGIGDYNKILQPYFSLDNPNIFSANDTRVALMQALNTLEETIKFDLLAHLATQPNREQALDQYQQKLTTTLAQVKQLDVGLVDQGTQLVITLREADQSVKTTLAQLNTILQNGAAEGPLTDAYHNYLKALRDRNVTQLEQATLNELLSQVGPLTTQAEKRLVNITNNRKALIQDVQVIDANDPGLSLIKKP